MNSPHFLLKDGYIRATQLSALNDPFEASYCQNSLNELSSYFEYCDQGDALLKYIEDTKNKIGVISFTEANDNLLMWSHYANEHKGALVGFNFADPNSRFYSSIIAKLFIPPIDSTCLDESWELFNGQCRPIMYRKQPRFRGDKFDYDYSNISAEGGDRILFEIFQQKSDEWIYEKEHRVTLKLTQADKVRVFDIDKIANKYLLSSIKKSPYVQFKERKGIISYDIYLNQINDPFERYSFASALANLSCNPNNIYLFKISLTAKSIYYGYRSQLNFNTENYKCVSDKTEIYKTNLSEDYYTVAFNEL